MIESRAPFGPRGPDRLFGRAFESMRGVVPPPRLFLERLTRNPTSTRLRFGAVAVQRWSQVFGPKYHREVRHRIAVDRATPSHPRASALRLKVFCSVAMAAGSRSSPCSQRTAASRNIAANMAICSTLALSRVLKRSAPPRSAVMSAIVSWTY